MVHSGARPVRPDKRDLSFPFTFRFSAVSYIALFSKKFITGMAGVVLAITAIGGGIIWLINAAVHK